MSMAPGAPSVQSSSFSNYSSGPTPGASTSSGIGTGDWFKEHALFILLGAIALVAILWYLSRRSGGTTLSPDAGYPLGYPSVGSGTSGGSGASSGGAGAADTGTAATQDTTTALDAFVKGFQLRDGQVQPQGSSSITDSHNTTNYYTTPDPIAPNLIVPAPFTPQPLTRQPQPPLPTPTVPLPIHNNFSGPPPPSLSGGITTKGLSAGKANLTPSKINDVLQQAFTQTGMQTKAQPAPAPHKNVPPKAAPKKPAHVTGGASQAPRTV